MSVEAVSNPFVGLRPFESQESLLFFGRQEQTLDLLQRLHQHHFLAVTGGSGSGKSSLIRAGLIPRLQAGYLVNESDRWVISIMKPGQTPLFNLAKALLTETALSQPGLIPTSLEEKIKAEGVDAVLKVLTPLWKNQNNLFLLVDQFEELFRFSLHKNDFERKDEAKDFVNILLALAAQKNLPIYVVLTMRSDFIGDCALIYGLPEAMNQSQYIVPRLTRLQLRNTIEGPIRLYNGTINAALTAMLLNDTQAINDELPLLQHALMRIWIHEKNSDKNGELDLEDYKSIGGIEKALCNHADEALKGMTPEELHITKKMFQALTAIDENGRKIRRPVRLSELAAVTGADSQQLLSIIQHFIEDNRFFLVISNIENENDSLIDISHESLIRQWSTLSVWVDEEAEARKTLLRLNETNERLTASAKLYRENKRDLLSGLELQLALHWFNSFKPDLMWAKRYGVDYEKTIRFLKESEIQWQKLQEEKEKQRLQKQRNRRLVFAALVVVILIISAFALTIYKNNEKNKKQLALNYWSSSQSARAEGDLLSSLHFTAEALALSNDDDLTKNLLTDVESFLPQASLQNIFSFSNIILNAVFHPDNKRIAVASNDGSVTMIDEETGKSTGIVVMHEAPVNSVAFSQDGKWLLTGSNDETSRVWETATGKTVLTLLHPASVTQAVFSADGKQILTACADSYVRFWNAATGEQMDSLEHDASVTTAAFSSDSGWILTSGYDSTAHLWESATKKQIAFFKHNGILTAASFNHDGTKILTASRDSTVRIWDAATKQLLITLLIRAAVTDASFSPDGRWIVTAGADGYARFWDVETGRQTGSGLQHEGPVFDIAFRSDGKQMLTSGWDKAVRVWNLPMINTSTKNFILKHDAIATAASFNSDGTKILSASYDSTVKIWDVATQKELMTLPHDNIVTSAVFSPDDEQVLTTCNDGFIRLWETSTGNKKDSFALKSPIANAVFSADGTRVLSADAKYNVYILNAHDLELVDSFSYQAGIKSIVFSPNDKSILIASKDSSAHLLDAKSKKQLALFKHRDEVSTAVFRPDGKKILTASYDFNASVWDVATALQIGPSIKHDAGIKSAVFSQDGKWIVTASWDKTTRTWDAVTLKEIGRRIEQVQGVNSAAFSSDRTKILTAGGDSTIVLWEITGDLDIPADLFKVQAQALTGVELNIETDETKCIQPGRWTMLKQTYLKKAREHYKNCKYPAYNLWRRFYPDEARTIRRTE